MIRWRVPEIVKLLLLRLLLLLLLHEKIVVVMVLLRLRWKLLARLEELVVE
jgi:hypothetical protein